MAIYENIKLDKGLYSTGKGFTAELESVDPSENYKGTSLDGLDAFERQLKRFDIKVSGAGSDTIEKFFGCCHSRNKRECAVKSRKAQKERQNTCRFL